MVEWTITLGQLIGAGSTFLSVAVGIWVARGWADGYMEEVKKRHRQNTLRMDFMLALINQQRLDDGKCEVPCPYRIIVDQ